MTAMLEAGIHQSHLAPEDNKFHVGNGGDGKHYWLTPPALLAQLSAEFGPFDFDPCPFPKPADFDGLTCEWGQRNYVNPPFGSIIHQGKKKGPTAWVRKSIEEWSKGKLVVLVYPVDKWVLMLLKTILGEHAHVRNLGDVRWLATEDGSTGQGNRAAHRLFRARSSKGSRMKPNPNPVHAGSSAAQGVKTPRLFHVDDCMYVAAHVKAECGKDCGELVEEVSLGFQVTTANVDDGEKVTPDTMTTAGALIDEHLKCGGTLPYTVCFDAGM